MRAFYTSARAALTPDLKYPFCRAFENKNISYGLLWICCYKLEIRVVYKLPFLTRIVVISSYLVNFNVCFLHPGFQN